MLKTRGFGSQFLQRGNRYCNILNKQEKEKGRITFNGEYFIQAFGPVSQELAREELYLAGQNPESRQKTVNADDINDIKGGETEVLL